nr:hypothetical protein [Halorubellus salinus]
MGGCIFFDQDADVDLLGRIEEHARVHVDFLGTDALATATALFRQHEPLSFVGPCLVAYMHTEGLGYLYVYDELTDRYEIFEYYYDVLVFMAVLGYREGRRETEDYLGSEDDGTRGSIGIDRFHNDSRYHAIVAALAFQARNDPSAMADPSVHAEVLAQYAAGGLQVFEEEFGDVAGDPTDALANYVKSVAEDQDIETEEDELQAILQSFDSEMFSNT